MGDDIYILTLTFDTDNDKSKTFTLNDVRGDVSASEATAGMDAAIAASALPYELTAKKKATLIKRSEKVLYSAA